MKKFLVILTTLVTISLLSINGVYAEEKYTIFVREGCQYCAKVKAFVAKYGLEDKVDFRETYNNEENSNAFIEAGKKYNVPDTQLGVPFMIVDEDTYLMGDQPMFDFFAQKYNLDISDLTEYQTSTSDMVFLVIGGLSLFGILGYGIYSMLNKKGN